MSDEDKYLRMTVNERAQHFLLMISFITLIVTGFALKFPEAFWVKWFSAVAGENAFEARGVIHRIASVVMIGVSIYHLGYITFTIRGRKLVKDFLPTKSDFAIFKGSILFLTGKKPDKPLTGRFSYIEKMEYWAVVWGTIIMVVTGMILWFENFFLKFVTNVGMDIATAVHYYEAILASLAILVWHFYYVFLNPDVYPMNKSWLSGYLSREEMEKEHPLELEQIEKQKSEVETETKQETFNEVEAETKQVTSNKESIAEKQNLKLEDERRIE